jgi:hypothetical protein
VRRHFIAVAVETNCVLHKKKSASVKARLGVKCERPHRLEAKRKGHEFAQILRRRKTYAGSHNPRRMFAPLSHSSFSRTKRNRCSEYRNRDRRGANAAAICVIAGRPRVSASAHTHFDVAEPKPCR